MSSAAVRERATRERRAIERELAESGRRFVPFERAHESGVVELLRSVYAEYDEKIELDTLDADLLDIERKFRSPDHVFRVLLDEQGVLGTVGVVRGRDNECELKRVFLHQRARGGGTGKRLVRWAIAWAREQELVTMHIFSDVLYDAAHRLYRRLGAEDTQLVRWLGGRNDVYEYYFRLELAER